MSTTQLTRRMTGGHALAEMVSLYEPGPIFGMGGFQLLPFYDGARQKGMRHILVNDERSGAFAADAWARATGRPGLCDGTFGPGATNLVTALVESYNAGIALVAFVGEGTREHSWKNMTQETRQQDILSPACKEYIRIESIQRIPELVRRAFSLATSGRPGPVILAIPEDISHDEFDFPEDVFWGDAVNKVFPAVRSRPDTTALDAAVSLLGNAERPVILAGGGVHIGGAYDELAEVAELVNAPVAHTLSGKGAISCQDSRSVGVFGRYSRVANKLIAEADVVLVVGCKLGEIATKRYTIPSEGTKIIHLDSLPEELGRWAPTDVRLLGDAKLGLADLAAGLRGATPPARTELWAEIETRYTEWQREADEKYTDSGTPIHMGRVIAEINRALPPEGVFVADGGFAAHWGGLLFDTQKAGRGFISDRGFASIGYGVPGAIGASLADADRPVISMTGDGGFNMVAGELETASREGLGFVLVIVNNAASGYVKALQHAVYGEGNYESTDLSEINYAEVAKAYKCEGIRVEDPAELAGALERALANTFVPTVVDVVVTRDPAKMLPAVDSRTLKVEPGDRPA